MSSSTMSAGADGVPASAGAAGVPAQPVMSVIDESLCQCCVCLGVMFGKIVTCREGHGVCRACYVSLPTPKKCPQCRVAYNAYPSRGIMVEHMIAAAQWPCKYCKSNVMGANMLDHLGKCPLRSWRCRFCGVIIEPSDVLGHFQHRSRGMGATGRHGLIDARKATSLSRWCLKAELDEDIDRGFHLNILLEGTDDVVIVLCQRVGPQESSDHGLLTAFHSGESRECNITFGQQGLLPRASFALQTRPVSDLVYMRYSEEDYVKGAHFSFTMFENAGKVHAYVNIFSIPRDAADGHSAAWDPYLPESGHP